MSSDPERVRRGAPPEALLAVLEHLAMVEVEIEPTEDGKRWAREQHAGMQERIAAMRQRLSPSHPGAERASPLRAEIHAMVRAEVLALLERLNQGGSEPSSPPKLSRLTDDDLRQMLAVLVETSPE